MNYIELYWISVFTNKEKKTNKYKIYKIADNEKNNRWMQSIPDGFKCKWKTEIELESFSIWVMHALLSLSSSSASSSSPLKKSV